MNRISCILLFTLIAVQGYAQNLLTNGSFEQYSSCPTMVAQMANANAWNKYTVATPDYFNVCHSGVQVGIPSNTFGYQLPAHGNAYAGLGMSFSSSTVNYYEYITTTFAAMTVGAKYEISMSVSLSENFPPPAPNHLGVLFVLNGPSSLPVNVLLPIVPQVSYSGLGPISNQTGWDRISATFIADSAYTRLVIGGFTNAQTTTPQQEAYYYIDSVVLKRLTGIQINYPAGTFCAGDTLHVPYTVLPGFFNAGNIFTLQLSGPTGSFAFPLNIGSIISTASGSIDGVLPVSLPPGTGYRVRVTSTNIVDVSADNGANIEIKQKPVSIASANTPLCAGSALSLNGFVTTGSSYSWTGPAFTSLALNPVINNAATSHSGDYILTANLNGCITKDTASVLVNPMPVISSINNNGPVCEGQSVQFTVQGSAAYSYNWAGPSYSSAVQNPVITTPAVANSGLYTVTATLNSCTSAPLSTNLLVNPMPAKPNTSNNSPVCTGGILNLFANSTTPGITYTWTGPNNFTSTLQNPILDPVSAKSNGKYAVTATLGTCTSEADTTIAVVNTVTYLGAYASPNDTICTGDLLTVVTVPVNGGVNPQFQWYKNNATITGATNLTYPTTAVMTGDSFYCRMIAGNVCSTPITLFSDKIGITVLPPTPAPTVTISSNPAQPLPGNAVVFTANITNGGSNPKLQWIRNGADIIGATSNTWTTNNLNPYDIIKIRLTVSEQCAEKNPVWSDSIVANFPTSVTRFADNNIITSPNPNNGNFMLKGKLGTHSPVDLIIINALGQKVYTRQVQPVDQNIELNIHTALPGGTYLLRLGDTTLRFDILQ